jgi:hypothetical protein
MGEKRNLYMLLVGKPEGKRQLGIPKRGRVANINVGFVEIRWCGVDWIGEEKVESSCECHNEPSGCIKCWETIEWLHNWWALE